MTTTAALLPLSNRGYPQILDHNGSGLIAYGFRTCIYIFDFRTSPPISLDSMVLRNSHQARVQSVSFCKSNAQLLASVGEDRFIKIWDLETATCVFSLQVKEKSCVVEWLYDSTTSVVFPDAFGCVTKWNFRSNALVRMKTSNDNPACILSSNKWSSELLAAGHFIGTVSVLNVNTLTLVYKLKAHSLEITSLSWSPILPLTLLSVSMDHSARLWKLGEVKPLKTYYYPTSRNKTDDRRKAKLCGACHPENPDAIICSNVRGEVGSVTFKENEGIKFNAYHARDFDSRDFKSIYIMLHYFTNGDDKRHLLLTVDYSKISIWDVSKEKLLSSFNFISGHVNYLGVSTINPNLLAVCTGDGFFRIWNTEATKIEITTIFVNLRSKIMAAAWHPTEENIVAYGSDEGRVGVIDIYRKKVLYSYEAHHSNTVYSLHWGPFKKLKDSNSFFLYSCGGGRIHIYELNKQKENPAEFDACATFPPDFEKGQGGYSELRWKSDFSCLVVGSFNRFVELFDDKLEFLARLTLQMKNIENLRWHPMCTFSSPSGSIYSSWLAAAGNDDNIHIFDTSDIKKQSESVFCKSTRTLVGHKKRVSSVCWSPHKDGYLVSASRDGTVQVWNAVIATCIAIYPYHRDLVYAVQWSVFDPDVVYSGGMDCCLRSWKISEQSQTLPDKKIELAKHKSYKIKEENLDSRELSPKTVKFPQKGYSDKKESEENVAKVTEETLVRAANKRSTRPTLELEGIFLNKAHLKKLFPDVHSKYSPKQTWLEDILKLTDLLCDNNDNDSQNPLQMVSKMTSEEVLTCGIYADQLTTLKMLETRANSEMKGGNIEKATFLQLMSCNIEPLLTHAAEKKQLSDFLVASAPTVSYEFWHNMCEKYAIQLVEEKQHMKASMYFLLCGKIYDAIQLLLEKNRFIEALAVAKSRLPETDPVLQKTYHKLAYQYSIDHLAEGEASCYLALKEPLQAAKVLFCTATSKHIYASTYICSKFNFIEEAKSYGYFCMEKCLSENDWPTFYKVLDLIDSLQVYKVLARVQEIVCGLMNSLKTAEDHKLFGITGNKLLVWEGMTYEDSNLSFLAYIYEVIKKEGILPADKESLKEIQQALDDMTIKRKNFEISAEVHVCVAIYITQVIVSSLLGELGLATKYFLQIFSSTCSNIGHISKMVSCLFLPLRLLWCCNQDTFVCECKIKGAEIFPFTTHFQDIYVSLCNKFASIGESNVKDFTVLPSISSDIDATVHQVLSILSKKTIEDSLLLYFSNFYLNELRKQAKKDERFKCYIFKKPPENMVFANNNAKHDTNSVEQRVSLEYGKKESTLVSEQIAQMTEHFENDANSMSMKYSPNETGECQTEVGIKSTEAISDVNDIKTREYETAAENVNQIKLYTSDIDDKNGGHETATKDVDEIKLYASNIIEDKNVEHQTTALDNIAETIASKNIDEIKSRISHIDNDNFREFGTALLKNTAEIKNGSEENGDNGEFGGTVVKNIAEIKSGSEENSNKTHETNVQCIKDDDDDHAQCWTDISLYYIVTKRLTSVVCKDDYALLFYLQKCLNQLNHTIADLARQKCTKFLVKSNEANEPLKNKIFTQECKGSETTPPSDQQTGAQENIPQCSTDLVTLKSDVVTDSEENTFKSVVANPTENSHALQENENTATFKNDENVLTENKVNHIDDTVETHQPNENELKYVVNGNCVQENTVIADNQNNKLDTQDEVNINENSNSDNHYLNENNKKSGESNAEEENDVDSCMTNLEKVEAESPSQKHISEKLQAEHKRISEQIKLLMSKEFCYPNPFDAVMVVNGICCDIFNKNPCKLIKAKFHELAHEVNQWSARFCTKDDTQVCMICNEKISA